MKHFFDQYGETIFFFLLALIIVIFYQKIVDLSLL
jgi:hypothetical protein